MSRHDHIKLTGIVTEVLPSAKFIVTCDNGHVVTAKISGRMMHNQIYVILSDRVQVRMSPYDLKVGQIIYRAQGARNVSIKK